MEVSALLARDDADRRESVIAQLDDSMVLSIAALRRGARAYMSGSPTGFAALAVEELPTEFRGFGNGQALADLMLCVQGWHCLEVENDQAAAAAGRLAAAFGPLIQFYGSVHYALHRPAPPSSRPDVRLLTGRDVHLFGDADPVLQVDDPARDLETGIVAGAVIEGRLLARASCLARSSRHGDIGVGTLPEYRGRGLATAAAGLVAHSLQSQGIIPVWSTGETNWASRQIAIKLGFTETSRLTYVIPRREQHRADPGRERAR